MATIYVDDEPFEVNPDENLLHNLLALGFNLPYFCWHPAMGSVGACRQCAVKQFKDENDTRGKIVMACMTPAADGTRISIRDEEAVAFRRSIIEGLMMNHPHDCPICDEGGECHLQDMTVMTGHVRRRYAFGKRTFQSQHLGPFLHHEMNRCIQCYRCVRYYREYAGGRDLDAFELSSTVFFGREKEGVLENEFAGNLVEICPTGVFTDATLRRHYTRKWDLQMAPSVCVHCALGCNITAGERYGTLRRIVNRYNGDVNGYFLCDRGRFGYEFADSDRRIRKARIRSNGKIRSLTAEDALEHFCRLADANRRVIGIGSPRASLESNFALRALVGPDRFYCGMSDHESLLVSQILEALRSGPAKTPSLGEIERCDAALILGEDLTNFAPRMALSLRQCGRQKPLEIARKLKISEWLDHAVREAVQDKKGPLFIATPLATRLDDIAEETCRAAPDDLARLGFAIAHALDPGSPGVKKLEDREKNLAARIAAALKEAERPLIVSGPGCGNLPLIRAAANVAWALCKNGQEAFLSYTAAECNSFGLALLEGLPLSGAFRSMMEGDVETAIILENDLFRRASGDLVRSALERTRHVVVIDHLENETAAEAELLLPAGVFAESDGTLVSSEGRAQRFCRTYIPESDIRESWRWLCSTLTAGELGTANSWRNLDDVTAAMAGELPVFAPATRVSPRADFRISGAAIPRQPHRYSGRTAMRAGISVHEPKPPVDADSPLSFSMEGSSRQPPAAVIPFFWQPGWNSIQAAHKYPSVLGGHLRGGNPGLRLIEPHSGDADFFNGVPDPFRVIEDQWLLLPVYRIFGSEELSGHAQGIMELTPEPYLLLNGDDAGRLDLQAGEEARLKINGTSSRLPVKIGPGLPRGIAGVPAGLTEMKGIPLPIWIGIERL